MAAKTMKTLDVATAKQWRAWLAKHHDSESEVWLIFHKRHTGRESIEYGDALDEALCYGWVDSLIKRLDEDRYARKFTPRKPDSLWSPINRKRYAALQAAGRVAPPGVQRPPGRDSYEARGPVPTEVPAYVQNALKKHAKAWAYFKSLAPSHRRNFLLWIHTAKREETRAKRLREAIRLLASGQTLGLK